MKNSVKLTQGYTSYEDLLTEMYGLPGTVARVLYELELAAEIESLYTNELEVIQAGNDQYYRDLVRSDDEPSEKELFELFYQN